MMNEELLKLKEEIKKLKEQRSEVLRIQKEISKLAKKSFEELTGIEAELIYNPVVIEKKNIPKLKDKIYLISATRLTSEKGGSRLNKLARILDNANIDYEWNIYNTYSLHSSPA